MCRYIPPKELVDCTGRQKRVAMYLKIFRNIYGIGKNGVRVDLPACIVARVRRTWPDDQLVHDDNDDNIDDAVTL